MSWEVIALLAAVSYVCVVTFVIALLRAAKAGDEPAEKPLPPDRERRRFDSEEDLELTPEDAEFLARLGRR